MRPKRLLEIVWGNGLVRASPDPRIGNIPLASLFEAVDELPKPSAQ